MNRIDNQPWLWFSKVNPRLYLHFRHDVSSGLEMATVFFKHTKGKPGHSSLNLLKGFTCRVKNSLITKQQRGKTRTKHITGNNSTATIPVLKAPKRYISILRQGSHASSQTCLHSAERKAALFSRILRYTIFYDFLKR